MIDRLAAVVQKLAFRFVGDPFACIIAIAPHLPRHHVSLSLFMYFSSFACMHVMYEVMINDLRCSSPNCTCPGARVNDLRSQSVSLFGIFIGLDRAFPSSVRYGDVDGGVRGFPDAEVVERDGLTLKSGYIGQC